MLELLQRLVALSENRYSVTNEINWDYVDADAYHFARSLYDTDDAFYAAFDAAAEMIGERPK
jgi:hypothetical protein